LGVFPFLKGYAHLDKVMLDCSEGMLVLKMVMLDLKTYMLVSEGSMPTLERVLAHFCRDMLISKVGCSLFKGYAHFVTTSPTSKK
jgi:hypothetical protein